MTTTIHDPATVNRGRRAWLAAKIAEARDGWHRNAAVDKLTRELGRLTREAARHGWTDPASDATGEADDVPTVDRAAFGLPMVGATARRAG